MLALVLAACGTSGSEGTTPAGGEASEAEAAFCGRWDDAVATGDDEKITSVLSADVPPAIADAAKVIVAADGESTPEVDEAGAEVIAWVEVHCNADAGREGADAADRRVAPPLSALDAFDEIALCHVTNAFGDIPSLGKVVIYGDGEAEDPYSKPMLGLAWGTEENHAGDGTKTPLTVRGGAGVAAPFTVFQQTILEELGTVIAWEERDLEVGLYGRFWDAGKTDELLAIADDLEFADGDFRLPDDALPDGYVELYAGDLGALGLVSPGALGEYNVQYQIGRDEPLMVTLAGEVMTEAQFEAFQFLTRPLDRSTVGEREMIVGNAWSEAGPSVVTWREPDGLAVRLVAIGAERGDQLALLQDIAAAARELDRDEWVELLEYPGQCDFGPDGDG